MDEAVVDVDEGDLYPWPKRLVEWTQDGVVYLSVAFTWDLQAAHQRAVWWNAEGYKVRAGGPADERMGIK